MKFLKTSHLLKERDQPGGYITPGRKISSLRRVDLKKKKKAKIKSKIKKKKKKGR